MSAGAAALFASAAYLAFVTRYGPGGLCGATAVSALSKATRPGSFAILRCADYAGEGHRIIALAALQVAGSMALVIGAARLVRTDRRGASILPPA